MDVGGRPGACGRVRVAQRGESSAAGALTASERCCEMGGESGGSSQDEAARPRHLRSGKMRSEAVQPFAARSCTAQLDEHLEPLAAGRAAVSARTSLALGSLAATDPREGESLAPFKGRSVQVYSSFFDDADVRRERKKKGGERGRGEGVGEEEREGREERKGRGYEASGEGTKHASTAGPRST